MGERQTLREGVHLNRRQENGEKSPCCSKCDLCPSPHLITVPKQPHLSPSHQCLQGPPPRPLLTWLGCPAPPLGSSAPPPGELQVASAGPPCVPGSATLSCATSDRHCPTLSLSFLKREGGASLFWVLFQLLGQGTLEGSGGDRCVVSFCCVTVLLWMEIVSGFQVQ